ncbi:MAG TPA: hypothetical protein DCM07_15620 [Planctomycetaceae bacterium]|nr:hypothetical protein [Planctomycetaceae bacterium]HBL44355.1 hypothetical protein [Planctomycetaceae bacterium]
MRYQNRRGKSIRIIQNEIIKQACQITDQKTEIRHCSQTDNSPFHPHPSETLIANSPEQNQKSKNQISHELHHQHISRKN